MVSSTLSQAAPSLMQPPCPTKLSAEDLARFRADGYLAFSSVLDAAELTKAREALSQLIARPDAEQSGTTVGSGRKVMVQFEPGFDASNASGIERELKVRKLMYFVEHNSFLAELAHSHPRVHGIVEQLLGDQPILFQDMALIKPPLIGGEKPWHQDNAYFAVEPLEAVCGVWIALDDATVANGCMHVIPGDHLRGPRVHIHDRDCEIPAARLDTQKTLAVPVPAGGAMFFYGLLPHQTPPNKSPDRRRAIQYHYRSASSRIIDNAEYDRLFVQRQDGAPASCDASTRRSAGALK